jgi:hypothetical protein
MDYRQLPQSFHHAFDAFVSIEMIEVGNLTVQRALTYYNQYSMSGLAITLNISVWSTGR